MQMSLRIGLYASESQIFEDYAAYRCNRCTFINIFLTKQPKLLPIENRSILGQLEYLIFRSIGVNLRKSLRLDKHLSIGMVIETVLYLVP